MQSVATDIATFFIKNFFKNNRKIETINTLPPPTRGGWGVGITLILRCLKFVALNGILAFASWSVLCVALFPSRSLL